jgi:butyrate kinase
MNGQQFATELGLKAYFVDPGLVDEFQDVSRITGLPQMTRKSRFHVLNSKATARRAAEQLGKTYESANVIVAHAGGGTTITAHCNGRIIDGADHSMVTTFQQTMRSLALQVEVVGTVLLSNIQKSK